MFCYGVFVFRLIRFFVWCLFWFLFLWLAVTVPIGNYTLYQHVMRMFHTKEAKDFKEGLKETAQDTKKKIEKEWQHPKKP